VYFDSFEALSRAADKLGSRLEGMPAQGVPFTSEISHEGLLSWGMDPPRVEQVPTWLEFPSWRQWLTNQLAVALLAAKQNKTSVEPWRFAVERLKLERVNVDTWTPVISMWDADAES